MKADSMTDAIAMMEHLKPRILAMPGMMRFINVHDDTGAGYIVSLVESQDVSDANQEAVKAMWANFADFLEEPPVPQGFDVVADWSN
jgi:hypothetical protein